MRRITIKPQAREDIREHVARIADEQPHAASRFFDAVENSFQLPGANPELGTQVAARDPALSGLRFRTIRRFRKYAIFYRFQDAGIEVLRVLHAARDRKALFDSRQP